MSASGDGAVPIESGSGRRKTGAAALTAMAEAAQ